VFGGRRVSSRRWSTSPRLEARRAGRRIRRLRNHRRRDRESRRGPPRPNGDAPFCGYNFATTAALANIGAKLKHPPSIYPSTGSVATPPASSSGRLRRDLRVLEWILGRWPAGTGERNRHRQPAARRTSTRAPRHQALRPAGAARVEPETVEKREVADIRNLPRNLRQTPPRRLLKQPTPWKRTREINPPQPQKQKRPRHKTGAPFFGASGVTRSKRTCEDV